MMRTWWIPLMLLSLFTACREVPPEPPAPVPAAAATEPPSKEAGPDPAAGPDAAVLVTLGGWPDPDDEDLIAHLSTAPVRGARRLSPRSMALRLVLEGGPDAVCKPRRRDDDTARHEVAFFRLSRLLETGVVPVSTIRRVPPAILESRLRRGDPAVADDFNEVVHRDQGGMVECAIIEWMTDLGPSPFDGTRGLARLAALLALDGPHPDEEPLVAPAAEMVVLDYLAGNWDRYTGGNLFSDATGRRLVLIDNNASFDSWSEGQQQRMEDLLASVERFSRSQIERVGLLTPEVTGAAMADGEDGRGRPLLTERELKRLFERKSALLAHIDTMVERHGAARVLALP